LKAGDPVYAFFTLREESGVSISAEPKSETFAELTHLIDGRKLAPVVTQVFPLSEVAKAQDQITTRHMRGKIVPRVAPELKSR
jgi:NADPH:quinone reductase-like Zn-dependent oxidoreductase